MLDEFNRFVAKQQLFDSNSRVLAAVSGGKDSVSLCWLLHRGGYNFSIAHCNFHLRGEESDRDEAFVRSLAREYGVECHVTHFDTRGVAAAEHLSIEEAARKLRYDYFERLRVAHGYDCIATAHHRDDSTETFFLNLMRGTGIAGLHGIRPRNGYIVHPMLPFGRDQIDALVAQEELQYVTDSTNSDVQFRRNAVRHQLMPLLRQLSPSIDRVMQDNIARLAETEAVFRQAVENERQKLFRQDGEEIRIEWSSVQNLAEPRRTYLFEMLRPYGFSAADVDTLLSMQADTSGRQILSPQYILLKDRGQVVLRPVQEHADEQPELDYQLEEGCPADCRVPRTEALFDADRLRFPLHLRHWRNGDRFVPFGMKGGQLLSDYFSNNKFSLFKKDSAWLLCDADDTILWVVGHRASNNARVGEATARTLHVRLKQA